MWRSPLCLFVAFSLPACSALSTDRGPSAGVTQAVAELSPGDECRVTLRPNTTGWASDSQVTYEGTVEAVTTDGVRLAASKMIGVAHSMPPFGGKLPPFIERLYQSTTTISQPVDETITIPVERIERLEPGNGAEAEAEPAQQTS